MDHPHDDRTLPPRVAVATRRPGICVVTRTWRSGAGWFAAELAHALARVGADVFFIAPALSPASHDRRHPALIRIALPREAHDGNRWTRLGSRIRRMARSAAALLTVAVKARPSHGVIFTVPDLWAVTLVMLLALKLLRQPIVVVVHDPVPHDYSAGARSGMAAIERRLTAWAYRLADRLVVLSEGSRRKLEAEFAGCAGKTSVIPHGAFKLDRRSAMPMTRTLLCFGSVRPNKNVLQVIQAVIGLRRAGCDVRLLVAGGADPSHFYAAACIAAAAQDPAGVALDFRYVDDERLPELMARVDACVLAYDNFYSQSGVAVLSGLAARPVIGSRAGGLQELRAMGLAGVEIASPITVDSIAAAIGTFFRCPAEAWRREAERGAVRLADQLDWDAIARRYLALHRP